MNVIVLERYSFTSQLPETPGVDVHVSKSKHKLHPIGK